MKVVLLAPTPPPAGGIAGWTVRMMNAKLKNNWEVAVVDEKIIGKREVFGEQEGRNYVTELKRCFRIWKGLLKELNDPETKVVHACIATTTFSMMREYISACLTKFRKRKFIIHFRCTVPNHIHSKIGLMMLKRLCKKSDLIMVLNEQTSKMITQITKTPHVIIPNFVTEDEIESTHIVRQEIKTVLYVGGVVKEKGAYDFIAAAQQFPDIEFRMVGKAAQEIIDYIESKKISNVVLTGAKSKAEVKEEYKNADIFAFLTYYPGEGFSNALCEAMAAGLPCIVTDWAANADMIDDGMGGYVVPVHDVSKVCDCLTALKDVAVRKNQMNHNLEKVKKYYTESQVINQYVDAYENILG